MSTTESSPVSGLRYLFGPFEADVARGELRKFGLRIRLERKPWQLLLCLLRRPAEVITREELRSVLWAENVFVDFDHGLNVAVKKLRAALCDSADSPEYIETIAGEGYKFLGSVELAPATAATAVPRLPAQLDNGLWWMDDPAGLVSPRVPARAGSNSRSAPVLPIVALAALIAAVVLAWLSLSQLPCGYSGGSAGQSGNF